MERARLALLVAASLANAGCPMAGWNEETALCAEQPHAWLLAPAASAASDWLIEAGFDVGPLPLDRSPRGLRGLIVFGAGAGEMPAYRHYVDAYADDLLAFVGDANLLLELRQDAGVEPAPPFLPGAQRAERANGELVELEVLAPDHPLLAGVAVGGGRLLWRGDVARGWFGAQSGLQVLLAGAPDGGQAALLEGAHRDGRILLTTLPLDEAPGGDPDRDAFAEAFFANLAEYAGAVCERRGGAVEPTLAPGTPEMTPGSSVLIALPDTQYYSRSFPGIFDSQTAWIARNADALNIRHVFHLGDIVDGESDTQWSRARDSMRLLDGVVPYTLVPGNHDYGAWAEAPPRHTQLDQWFSYDEAARASTFGGAYEEGKLENTYSLFEAGGREWIALALEWGPRDEVIAWANQVMREHPDRLGILVTHAYLNHNDLRYDHTDTQHPQDYNPHSYPTPGSVNDGEELWQKLVRHHRFVMTLSGHVLDDGTGYLASQTDLGNTCHQMLSNYQTRELGGEGYLRILELLPDGQTIQVRTYSPLYDRYLTGTDQELTLHLGGI